MTDPDTETVPCPKCGESYPRECLVTHGCPPGPTVRALARIPAFADVILDHVAWCERCRVARAAARDKAKR